MKNWLTKYKNGGDKSKDLNYGDDYSKSKSNMNMLELSKNTPAPKKAYKFDPKTLPHAPANMQEAQQMVDAKEKHKDKVTASEKLAYSRMTKAQKEKYNTAKAKEEYVNNPGFMDYASQIGYMPLLAMSNPFNMGEKLKELRAIKVNDNLSPWQKFDQMGNVSTEATGNALINAATDGLVEGIAPAVINKITKYGDDVIKKINKSNFKSEIDWGNWNKEIVGNKKLIKEYKAIEKTSKADNTWMKNPDGSEFDGTPEQFVQQNSENFKKAYPEGFDKTYRGTQAFNPELVTLRGHANSDGPIIFGTSNKSVAENYATHTGYNLEDEFQKAGKRVEFYHPDKSKIGTYTGESKDINPGLFELGVGKDLDKFISQGNDKKWYNVENKEVSDWLKKRDPNARDNTWFEELLPDKVKTDDIASYMREKEKSIGLVKNVDDGADFFGNPVSANVTMINPKKARVKSLMYNNGMFDMNNPNIYKALVPAIAGSAAYGLQEKKNGGWLNNYK